VAYGMQIMRLLCGANWRPLRVSLAHSVPPDLAAYRRMFGPQLRFNANVSALEFPAALLRKPVIGADTARYAPLRDRLRQRILSDNVSFANQVRRALRPMILAGTASAPNVANLFLISDRVLRGRLAGERTTVRRLLQQTRLEMAIQLLRTTRLSVSNISAAVGYSDPPSFVRAFRSHFDGVTPGEWQARFVRSERRRIAPPSTRSHN
jgi:AraC-like DNA-binding protein